MSDSDTESIDEFSDVLTCIKEWVVECQTPMSSLSSFLEIMRPYFPTLPKDPRTLFRTKTMYDTVRYQRASWRFVLPLWDGVRYSIQVRGQFSDTEPFVIVEAGDRGRPLKCDFHLQWLHRMLNVQRSVQIARRLGGSKRWTPLLI